MSDLSDYLQEAFEGEIDSRCLRLFEDVAEEQTRRFANRCRTVDLRPGDTLFTAFDEQRYLYILLMGNVKTLVVTPSGREQITHLFFPGDVFGGLIFGPNQSPRPWAKAVDSVRLIALDQAEFMELMRTAPKLCLNIFDYMVTHHHQDLRRLQTMIHTRASHRLVLTLLHLGDRQGDEDQDTFEICIGLTHEDYANMIGVVRSTVSELVGELRRGGVIAGSRRRLVVDRRAAERFLQDA